MRLGEKLYLLREEQGLSQEELAEKLNVSRQTISNWENDKVKLDVEKAGELSRLFNVSMDELFCGKKPSGTKDKPSLIRIALFSAVLVICTALIVISAVFLAKYRPDETSSVITLSAAVGWIVVACCAVIIAGVTIGFIIYKSKRK